MHIGVFDVLNKVLLQKLSGDVSKKTLFFCRFFGFICICIQNPYFLVLAFLFVGFEFLCFFFLLLFQKSSCYVVVSAFCCIGFPWFFSVVCVVFFGLCLASLFFLEG